MSTQALTELDSGVAMIPLSSASPTTAKCTTKSGLTSFIPPGTYCVMDYHEKLYTPDRDRTLSLIWVAIFIIMHTFGHLFAYFLFGPAGFDELVTIFWRLGYGSCFAVTLLDYCFKRMYHNTATPHFTRRRLWSSLAGLFIVTFLIKYHIYIMMPLLSSEVSSPQRDPLKQTWLDLIILVVLLMGHCTAFNIFFIDVITLAEKLFHDRDVYHRAQKAKLAIANKLDGRIICVHSRLQPTRTANFEV